MPHDIRVDSSPEKVDEECVLLAKDMRVGQIAIIKDKYSERLGENNRVIMRTHSNFVMLSDPLCTFVPECSLALERILEPHEQLTLRVGKF